MKLAAPTFAIFCIIAPALAQTPPVPKFDQFPSPAYRGPVGHLDLSSPDAYSYRTRLRNGAQQPVNFAGHYQLIQWGCGTTCSTGAVIDALTGRVTFLPAVMTQGMQASMDANFNSIEFRVNSRLIVFSGQLNETGVLGTHFYLWNGSALQHVATISFVPPTTVKQAPQQPSVVAAQAVPPAPKSPDITSPGADHSGCWSISDAVQRLACYDKETANVSPPPAAAPSLSGVPNGGAVPPVESQPPAPAAPASAPAASPAEAAMNSKVPTYPYDDCNSPDPPFTQGECLASEQDIQHFLAQAWPAASPDVRRQCLEELGDNHIEANTFLAFCLSALMPPPYKDWTSQDIAEVRAGCFLIADVEMRNECVRSAAAAKKMSNDAAIEAAGCYSITDDAQQGECWAQAARDNAGIISPQAPAPRRTSISLRPRPQTYLLTQASAGIFSIFTRRRASRLMMWTLSLADVALATCARRKTLKKL